MSQQPLRQPVARLWCQTQRQQPGSAHPLAAALAGRGRQRSGNSWFCHCTDSLAFRARCTAVSVGAPQRVLPKQRCPVVGW